MSCGEDHDVDCSEILQRVYVFIDNELEDASTDEIRQHLEECAPCLDEYDLERCVKKLVHRSCGDDHAPDALAPADPAPPHRGPRRNHQHHHRLNRSMDRFRWSDG